MSIALGLAACGLASFCFGTMYVPIRRVGNPGDGIFVQWLICSAIFHVGLLTYIAIDGPPFQPFAMIGGALWALGNLTAIPIINVIGVGMGILIWGVIGCVIGWAIGRFGLFGTEASVPSSPNVNYAGLVLVLIGGTLFAFIRPKPSQNSENVEESTNKIPPSDDQIVEREKAEETSKLMMEEEIGENEENGKIEVKQTEGEEEKGKQSVKEEYRKKGNTLRGRIIAIMLAVFAGICYGSMFTPVVYMQDNPQLFDNPPTDAIYYVFSHFTGIYLTSTVVLLIYIAYKRNKPFVCNRLVFPSLLAGVFWAIAMLAWSATFPINGMAPGLIASLWSVLYFKEIEKTELKKLFVAMFITLLGVILVGISKTL